jgi:hypothetical protein
MTAICVAIFIMFMGIRPAPAIELPKEILGAWCGQWSYQFPNDDTTMHWWSVDNVENCGNPGGVTKMATPTTGLGLRALASLQASNSNATVTQRIISPPLVLMEKLRNNQKHKHHRATYI